MDDAGTTTATSAAAPGSLGDGEGGASGSQPTAGSLAEGTGLDADARYREWQSRADRAEARAKELERQLAEARATTSGSSTPEAPAGLTLETLRAEMRRTAEIAAAIPTLKDEFTYADQAIFTRADEFDSVEALRAAVEDSHKSIEARIQPAVQAEIQALKERYAARFGPLTDDITAPGNTPAVRGDGMPTPEEVAAMSFSEYRAFADAHPEFIQSLLRTE